MGGEGRPRLKKVLNIKRRRDRCAGVHRRRPSHFTVHATSPRQDPVLEIRARAPALQRFLVRLLALVDPLAEHVDGLREVVDRRRKARAADAALQLARGRLAVHDALDRGVPAERALEGFRERGLLFGDLLLRRLLSPAHPGATC